MARRTIDEQITILEAERDRLEQSLAETHPYSKLKAQGMFGSETTFVDYEATHRRLDRVKEQLTALYNARGY